MSRNHAQKPISSPRRRHPRPREDVRDIMTAEVVTVQADVTVSSLVEMLLARGLSRVPVVDAAGRLIGMVGMTDVVSDVHLRGDTGEMDRAPTIPAGEGIQYLPDGFHLHPVETLVSEVMNRGVISVPPDASIREAARLLRTHRLHGLPVADGAGALVGFVSASDIVAWVATSEG
jgi:CBS domain-containing protein